jgi:nitrogen fixation protein NifU and related proteins
MFSAALLDHFEHPRNAGALPHATVQVEATNPVCGDVLQLAARMENGLIAEIRFLCRGCTTSIACASLLTEKLKGTSLEAAQSINAEVLSSELGNLPSATFHGAQLAIDALHLLAEGSKQR